MFLKTKVCLGVIMINPILNPGSGGIPINIDEQFSYLFKGDLSAERMAREIHLFFKGKGNNNTEGERSKTLNFIIENLEKITPKNDEPQRQLAILVELDKIAPRLFNQLIEEIVYEPGAERLGNSVFKAITNDPSEAERMAVSQPQTMIKLLSRTNGLPMIFLPLREHHADLQAPKLAHLFEILADHDLRAVLTLLSYKNRNDEYAIIGEGFDLFPDFIPLLINHSKSEQDKTALRKFIYDLGGNADSPLLSGEITPTILLALYMDSRAGRMGHPIEIYEKEYNLKTEDVIQAATWAMQVAKEDGRLLFSSPSPALSIMKLSEEDLPFSHPLRKCAFDYILTTMHSTESNEGYDLIKKFLSSAISSPKVTLDELERFLSVMGANLGLLKIVDLVELLIELREKRSEDPQSIARVIQKVVADLHDKRQPNKIQPTSLDQSRKELLFLASTLPEFMIELMSSSFYSNLNYMKPEDVSCRKDLINRAFQAIIDETTTICPIDKMTKIQLISIASEQGLIDINDPLYNEIVNLIPINELLRLIEFNQWAPNFERINTYNPVILSRLQKEITDSNQSPLLVSNLLVTYFSYERSTENIVPIFLALSGRKDIQEESLTKDLSRVLSSLEGIVDKANGIEIFEGIDLAEIRKLANSHPLLALQLFKLNGRVSTKQNDQIDLLVSETKKSFENHFNSLEKSQKSETACSILLKQVFEFREPLYALLLDSLSLEDFRAYLYQSSDTNAFINQRISKMIDSPEVPMETMDDILVFYGRNFSNDPKIQRQLLESLFHLIKELSEKRSAESPSLFGIFMLEFLTKMDIQALKSKKIFNSITAFLEPLAARYPMAVLSFIQREVNKGGTKLSLLKLHAQDAQPIYYQALKQVKTLLTSQEGAESVFNLLDRGRCLSFFRGKETSSCLSEELQPEVSQELASYGIKHRLFDKEDVMSLLSIPLGPTVENEIGLYGINQKLFNKEDMIRLLSNPLDPDFARELASYGLKHQLIDKEDIIRFLSIPLNPEFALKIASYGLKHQLIDKEDIITFFSTPQNPELAHKLATYVLEKRLFHEDEPIFDQLVSLGIESAANSPHGIYRMHLDNQKIPPNPDIHPPKIDIDGIPASLSLEGLQESANAFSVEMNQIPKNATVENWRTLCANLKSRIENSPSLRLKYEDFETVRLRVLNDPYYEQLLDFSRYSDKDHVPTHKAQFAAIVSFLLSHDTTPTEDGAGLSEQEEKLYLYALTNINCTTGKRQNNSNQYRDLPKEFRYQAKGLESGEEADVLRGKQAVLEIIHDLILQILETDSRLYEALFGATFGAMDVHNIEYVKNSVGHLLGLGSGLIFDQYVNSILKPRDEILKICLEHLTPDIFIEAIKKMAIEEMKKVTEANTKNDKLVEVGTLNDLITSAIGTSSLFWKIDDETFQREITDQGVLQMLRLLGVVDVKGPPMVVDWIHELAVVAKPLSDFHFERVLDGSQPIARQMRELQKEIEGDLKQLKPKKRSRYLSTWLQNKQVIHEKLSQSVPVSQEKSFEECWKKLVESLEKSYMGALQQTVTGRLNKSDPLSLVTLIQTADHLFHLFFPDTFHDEINDPQLKLNKIRKLKDDWKSRISLITNITIDQEIEKPHLLRTLSVCNFLADVLPSNAQTFFAEKMADEEFVSRRFASFKEELNHYQEAFRANSTFKIKPFIQFCQRAALLLPPVDLSKIDGYSDVAREIEDLIQAIKDKADRVHILDLKKAKEAYDPLAEKLGHAPMEIEMPM